MVTIGIDIGGTNIHGVLLDSKGKCHAFAKTTTTAQLNDGVKAIITSS